MAGRGGNRNPVLNTRIESSLRSFFHLNPFGRRHGGSSRLAGEHYTFEVFVLEARCTAAGLRIMLVTFPLMDMTPHHRERVYATRAETARLEADAFTVLLTPNALLLPVMTTTQFGSDHHFDRHSRPYVISRNLFTPVLRQCLHINVSTSEGIEPPFSGSKPGILPLDDEVLGYRDSNPD